MHKTFAKQSRVARVIHTDRECVNNYFWTRTKWTTFRNWKSSVRCFGSVSTHEKGKGPLLWEAFPKPLYQLWLLCANCYLSTKKEETCQIWMGFSPLRNIFSNNQLLRTYWSILYIFNSWNADVNSKFMALVSFFCSSWYVMKSQMSSIKVLTY